MKNKTLPFLWFNKDIKTVFKFYRSVFKKSKVIEVDSMSGHIQLNGLEFLAFNGGKYYQFSPAISFYVPCKTQKEIDYYWDQLKKKGKILQCGWITDQFGVTWQIVPEILGDLLGDSNQEKAGRAHEAMMGMKKLDIDKLKKAHQGK